MRISRALVGAALVLGLVAVPFEAQGGKASLGEVLQAELGLTRQAVALEQALATLEHEQTGAEYSAELLDHAGRESLRLLDAYRGKRQARQHLARQRARAMYKASRGGIARLVFEDAGDGETADSSRRLARGRDLRWMVRRDLKELAAYQRSERRAQDELLQAHRQLQALSVLATVHAVQSDLVGMARTATIPALGRAHKQSKRWYRRAPARTRDKAVRKQLRELRNEGKELRELQRGERRLLRPVRGRVVGTFGEYTDPVLKLPMMRNGIELKARRDEAVRAPDSGEVVMVASLPGFEQVVVIDHGEGRMSMIGRLWKANVAEGEQVETGQTIAFTAPKVVDDGLGSTIYLELRLGDKPVDPTPLLKRR
ncbi:MAG: peptidoglycan DD-metalloendopeptidase family protein [Myxococcota bacterium]